ncbi:MAG: F0F1 ATP synthase subunit B' [Pseudomonadota bacterium]
MATETTGGEEAATGLPQLDFSTFPNQIFWLVVTLVAIYFILQRVALPRIAGVLAERSGTITNDIATAEELKLKAQEAEAAYDKALADARAEAQSIAAEARAEIQGELDDALAKADAEIAAKAAESEAKIAEIRAGALDAIRDVSQDAAGEIAGAMGAEASADEIAAAVAERMKG